MKNKLPEFDSPKNWTEDYDKENGNYTCACSICKELFYGYKRRVVCRECSDKFEPPQTPDKVEEIKNILLTLKTNYADADEPILGIDEAAQAIATLHEGRQDEAKEYADKAHHEALIHCCVNLLKTIDSGKTPNREIKGMRLLIPNDPTNKTE